MFNKIGIIVVNNLFINNVFVEKQEVIKNKKECSDANQEDDLTKEEKDFEEKGSEEQEKLKEKTELFFVFNQNNEHQNAIISNVNNAFLYMHFFNKLHINFVPKIIVPPPNFV